MTRMKTTGVSLAFAACAAAGVRADSPAFVGDLTVTTNALTRCVEVTYNLEREAIVTFDALTNGVSIGGRHLRRLTGAVNRRVAAGHQTLQWAPDSEWAGADGLSLRVRAYATDNPPDYLVASLILNETVRFYETADALPGGLSDPVYATDALVMRKVPAKGVRCRLGTPTTEPLRAANAREWLHTVEFTNDYYAAVYPVTQAQYRRLMGSSGGAFLTGTDAPRRPVTSIAYSAIRGLGSNSLPLGGHQVTDASYIGKLRAFTGIRSLDLPTEARWEYAARAGCGNSLYTGVDLDTATSAASTAELDEVAWTYSNTSTNAVKNSTMPVGLKRPNAWGLYDMIGNCMEICLDYATTDWQSHFGSTIAIDPVGPTTWNTGSPMCGLRSSSPWDGANALKDYRVGVRFFVQFTDKDSPHNYRGFRVFCDASL